MRATLTPRSSAFRHALRLGIALSLATALYLGLHLPGGRGYWIPLTVMLVLRSDFITTFTRGIARLLGTMLGAVLTTLLVVVLAPSQPVLVAIITVAAYVMYATVLANYVLFSLAITTAIVFLLSFVTSQTAMTAAERAFDTTIGGVLALLIYALWPTWEQSQVPATIARYLETLGHYLDAILHCYANPDEQRTDTRDQRHLEESLARSNARGSVHRMLQEPKAHRVPAELAAGLLEAADSMKRRGLTLEAYMRDHPQHYALPEMAAFGTQVDQAMSKLAAALREKKQPPPLPDLPEALRALQAAVRANKHAQDEARAQWHFLIAEAKRIVRNVEAIRQLLLTGSFMHVLEPKD